MILRSVKASNGGVFRSLAGAVPANAKSRPRDVTAKLPVFMAHPGCNDTPIPMTGRRAGSAADLALLL